MAAPEIQSEESGVVLPGREGEVQASQQELYTIADLDNALNSPDGKEMNGRLVNRITRALINDLRKGEDLSSEPSIQSAITALRETKDEKNKLRADLLERRLLVIKQLRANGDDLDSAGKFLEGLANTYGTQETKSSNLKRAARFIASSKVHVGDFNEHFTKEIPEVLQYTDSYKNVVLEEDDKENKKEGERSGKNSLDDELKATIGGSQEKENDLRLDAKSLTGYIENARALGDMDKVRIYFRDAIDNGFDDVVILALQIFCTQEDSLIQEVYTELDIEGLDRYKEEMRAILDRANRKVFSVNAADPIQEE